MYEHFRILICDDSNDDVLLLERALTRAGIHPHLVALSSGRDAVEFLSGTGPFKDACLPNVILLDVNMPGMDGFDVLAWIRHHPPLQAIPVIMLSGSDDQTDIDRAYRAGASGYIPKSHDPQAYDAIASTLGQFWLQNNQYPGICGTKCAALHTQPSTFNPL